MAELASFDAGLTDVGWEVDRLTKSDARCKVQDARCEMRDARNPSRDRKSRTPATRKAASAHKAIDKEWTTRSRNQLGELLFWTAVKG